MQAQAQAHELERVPARERERERVRADELERVPVRAREAPGEALREQAAEQAEVIY